MTFNVFPAGSPLDKQVIFHADAGVNFTLTNSPLTERFALNANRHIKLANLSGFTQVRFIAVVAVASVSVSTPLLRLRYYTGWTATFANYLQLGLSQHVELSLFTGTANTLQDTGWLDMALGARANGIALAMCELGGNATADPAVNSVQAWFR